MYFKTKNYIFLTFKLFNFFVWCTQGLIFHFLCLRKSKKYICTLKISFTAQMAHSWNSMLKIWLKIPLLSLIESLIIRQSFKHFCCCGAPCMTSNKVMTCSGCVLEVYRASASAWKPTKLSLFCLTAKIMSISARMHFFPPFAGHASFRELSKLWQEVFFKLDLGWLAGALLSTLIKLPAVYL